MPGNLCEHCVGYCCRHIALPIERPAERSDFEDIRWYILHEGVSVFVEDGDWYLHVQTTCRHLQPDYRCGIYETRPQICRDYSTDNCDYHSGDYGWEHHFTAAEQLDLYVEDHYGSKKKRKPTKNGKAASSRSSSTNKNRKKGRAGVKIKLQRRDPARRFNASKVDRGGVLLPVLGMRR